MAGQIRDHNLSPERIVGDLGVHERDRRGRSLQVHRASLGGGLQLLGQRSDCEFLAMGVENFRHEDISAAENVPRHRLAGHTEDARDRHLAFDHRHVAALTAADAGKRAVLPLEVGHLLGQLAHHLTVGIESVGEEGVAGGADLRALDVVALCGQKTGGGTHQAGSTGIDFVRPEDLPLALGGGGVETEACREAGALAEILVLDLMTDGTRYAVNGQNIAVAEGKVAEDLALASFGIGLEARHRHVAGRALVLDRGRGGRVNQRLAFHGGVPVGVAGRVGHHRAAPADADRDILTGRSHEAVVAGHAALRGDEEVGNLGAYCRSADKNERDHGNELDGAFHGSTTPRRACRRTSPTTRRRPPGSFSPPVR